MRNNRNSPKTLVIFYYGETGLNPRTTRAVTVSTERAITKARQLFKKNHQIMHIDIVDAGRENVMRVTPDYRESREFGAVRANA